MIDAALLRQARTMLQDRSIAIETLQFGPLVSRRFTFDAIKEGFRRGEIVRWLRESLGEHVDKPAIYRITASEQNAADLLYRTFVGLGDDRGYKIPRNNQIQNSTTVYVGSSQDIKKRIREHLQKAHHTTYALKMGLWCPQGIYSVTIEIIAVLGDPTPSQVQDVEDALWINSRPMFGKMGPI